MAHVFEKKWRSGDVKVKGNVDFKGLLLSEKVLQGLTKAGFKKPSPIQLEAIPTGRFGKDMMVQAKSGTGKTLVFVVTALEMLKPKLYRPQIMVIVPTREIATQVCDVFKAVGSAFHNLTCNSFIGGLPVYQDKEIAVMTQIVVGTPGRLRQLINQKSLPTNSIRLLVFDEADELLHSPSFKDDLENIFTYLPDDKQVIATSATYSNKVKKIMYRYLCDPVLIRLNVRHLALLGMIHYAVIVEFCPASVILYRNKLKILEQILKTVRFAQCLLFCNGISRVELLFNDVKKIGFSAAFMSSAKEQVERLKAIDRLKHFKCKVLVSSDLTARGIDAENVDLVINFDLPYSSEVYLHRVGRAGRYGSVGAAISLVDTQEIRHLQKIEKDGSFKTLKLPDPIPKDLILNPPEAEYVIPDKEFDNKDCFRVKRSPCIIKSDELESHDSDMNDASEKKLNAKNTDVEAASENCENNLLELVDNELKSYDRTGHILKCEIVEKEDQNDITHLKSKKNKSVKSKSKMNETNKPSIDQNLQNGYTSDSGEDKIQEDDLENDLQEFDLLETSYVEMMDDKGGQTEIASLKSEENKIIHSIEQSTDNNFSCNYTCDDDTKLDENKHSDLLNHFYQNETINSKSTEILFTHDVCDKSELIKQDKTKDDIPNNTLLNYQPSYSSLEQVNFEANRKELIKSSADNLSETSKQNEVLEVDSVIYLPEISKQKNITKHVKDDKNCDQESVEKSCDELNNHIKAFVDRYENESNKKSEFFTPNFTFDRDSHVIENSGKACITNDMINNLQLQKHDFFYKTFKKFQESKVESSDISETEIEDKGKSNEPNSSSDLVTDKVTTAHTELVEKSEFETTVLVNKEIDSVDAKLAEMSQFGNKADFLEKPIFESTPEVKDKIKQITAKIPPTGDSCKPILESNVSQSFEEISDDSDSDDSVSSEETSEVAKQSSTDSKSKSSHSDSDSVSSSSNSSSVSSSKDSEEESDSETDSESSSDASSSDDTSSISEDEESIYHHNYSRTGRQNPSLVSDSVKGKKVKYQIYTGQYYQNTGCICSVRQKMNLPLRNQCSKFSSNSNSVCCRNIENIPHHYHSSSFNYRGNYHNGTHPSGNRRLQKYPHYNLTQDDYSRQDRSRNSRSDATRDQNSFEYPMHQRSSGHEHTLDCFMPSQHVCHPNTPEYPCNHGHICEMWYKTFYNQWMFIQNAQKRMYMPF